MNVEQKISVGNTGLSRNITQGEIKAFLGVIPNQVRLDAIVTRSIAEKKSVEEAEIRLGSAIGHFVVEKNGWQGARQIPGNYAESSEMDAHSWEAEIDQIVGYLHGINYPLKNVREILENQKNANHNGEVRMGMPSNAVREQVQYLGKKFDEIYGEEKDKILVSSVSE